jgi:hypothetical protein
MDAASGPPGVVSAPAFERPIEGQLVLGEDPRAEPPAQDADPFEDPEEERFRENLERITGIVGRSLMIGIPVFFIVLALLLPVWEAVRGPGGMTIAFLAAAAAAWALQRWRERGRGRRPPPRRPAPARGPGSVAAARSGPGRSVVIGLALLALAYVVFVLVMSRGGA